MSEEKTTTMQPAQSRVEVLDYLEIRRPGGARPTAGVRGVTICVALDFLQLWAPEGPWVLTAIPVDRKGIETKTFRPESESALLEWLVLYNGKRNIYFHVNPPIQDLDKKANREDIKSVDWLHVDIDPRAGEDLAEERVRALELLTSKLPAPTAIVFSGGGYQGFWRLETPIPIDGDVLKAEDAKRYNIQLELMYKADNCHNIDRIMRLPGTINLPDARKRKKGRVATLATLVEFNNNSYPIDAFTKAGAPPSEDEEVTPKGETAPVDLDALSKRLDDVALDVIVNGYDTSDPDRWGGDRSRAVFFAACEMARARFQGDEIAAVLIDRQYKISESVLELRGTARERYAERQATRALDQINTKFVVNKNTKKPIQSQRNIRLACRKLGVALSYDEFAGRYMIEGLTDHGPILQDAGVMTLRLLIDEKFKFLPAKELFLDVVKVYALNNRYDPVLNYLDGLHWDGMPRLDDWLTTYGGAESSDYTKAVGALMLIAGVRRAREPGCKFDEMLVLVSGQGLNKSSAVRTLVPTPDLFTDNLPLNARSKEVIEQLAGIWIAEFAELHGKTTAGIEHVKAFQSRQVDRARAAYGRIAEEVPRRCIFFGTTNTLKFMNDPTGGRRFWPVTVKRFDVDALRRDRDQLWAEAAHREAADESIRLDPALYDSAAEVQSKHEVENPFVDVLARALGAEEGKIRSADCWDIVGVPTAQRTQDHNDRLGKAMQELGWKRNALPFGRGKNERCYTRGEAPYSHIEAQRGDGGSWEVMHVVF